MAQEYYSKEDKNLGMRHSLIPKPLILLDYHSVRLYETIIRRRRCMCFYKQATNKYHLNRVPLRVTFLRPQHSVLSKSNRLRAQGIPLEGCIISFLKGFSKANQIHCFALVRRLKITTYLFGDIVKHVVEAIWNRKFTSCTGRDVATKAVITTTLNVRCSQIAAKSIITPVIQNLY